jgi:4-amino-4-deoxy-L-arabinose transferase-like glycosyltransferase
MQIAVLSLTFSLILAALFPLVDPDEGRNAEIAREMATSGQLLVPQLAGMPYLDKPPGYFWAAAAAIRLFGPVPFAARLPSVLAGFVTLLLIARAAREQAGDGFAWRATALLAAAPLFMALCAYAIFDMMLALCVTIVWLGLANELSREVSPSRRLAMFAAVALGVLVKGPVMLIWAFGGSAAAALLMRSRAPLRWLAFLPGWVLVLAIAGGWFALASRSFPEYPRYAFLEESFERLTSGTFKREQPLWFVPAVLVGGALPWSLTTPWRRAGSGPGESATRTARVGLGFLLFALVFFSASRSKLVTYLLPAMPPLAWLAACAWSRATFQKRGRVVLAASLLAPPLALAAAGPRLYAYARASSGAPLAEAIGRNAPDAAIRYERCYSPGTDYLLGRRSAVVSDLGYELRSTYQIRYRPTLMARGQWTPRAAPAADEGPGVIVRRSRDATGWPSDGREFFRDRRFAAARITR